MNTYERRVKKLREEVLQAKKEREQRAKRKAEQGNTERQTIETEQETEEVEDLTSKTVPELKEMAKEKGIEGYATMKKNELITALE